MDGSGKSRPTPHPGTRRRYCKDFYNPGLGSGNECHDTPQTQTDPQTQRFQKNTRTISNFLSTISTSFAMKSFFPILTRTFVTFGVFCALQYIIPWYLLAPAGIVAGFFMLKTGDDRPLAVGVLAGSIAFAVFAYAMAQIFPVL